MFSSQIRETLNTKLPNTPRIECAPTIRNDIDELVSEILPSGKVAIVDDSNTAGAFGDHINRSLKNRFDIARIDCGKAAKADMSLVDALRKQSRKSDLIIAVGSGTINDLCKYASYLDKKPYIVFPTAASMNGYLSGNASITEAGFKKSVPAHLPKAVFCDLRVIASAPVRLSKSGLGDSLARPTAQWDWYMSHKLLGTDYTPAPFNLLLDKERELFDSARAIALRDAEGVGMLLEVLLLSGLGMTIAGSSNPASQAEHMLSHAYSMLPTSTPPTLHGEEIGVTALMCAQSQEALLRATPFVQCEPYPMEQMLRYYGEEVALQGQQAYTEKTEKVSEAGLGDLKAVWPQLCEELEQMMIPSSQIQHILSQAQAPADIESLEWNPKAFGIAASTAHYLRNRFTCLDLQVAKA